MYDQSHSMGKWNDKVDDAWLKTYGVIIIPTLASQSRRCGESPHGNIFAEEKKKHFMFFKSLSFSKNYGQ